MGILSCPSNALYLSTNHIILHGLCTNILGTGKKSSISQYIVAALSCMARHILLITTMCNFVYLLNTSSYQFSNGVQHFLHTLRG
jgi:hypothetical protein